MKNINKKITKNILYTILVSLSFSNISYGMEGRGEKRKQPDSGFEQTEGKPAKQEKKEGQTTIEKKLNILDLPEYVTKGIFSYLDNKEDLRSVFLTCKTFNEYISPLTKLRFIDVPRWSKKLYKPSDNPEEFLTNPAKYKELFEKILKIIDEASNLNLKGIPKENIMILENANQIFDDIKNHHNEIIDRELIAQIGFNIAIIIASSNLDDDPLFLLNKLEHLTNMKKKQTLLNFIFILTYCIPDDPFKNVISSIIKKINIYKDAYIPLIQNLKTPL